MTLNELIAKYNALAASVGMPTRKGFDNKSKAEASLNTILEIVKAKSGEGAKLKIRKAAQVHQKGPRGFKFGPIWMRSISEGKGVALKPQNMPKLLETATFKGIQVTPDLSQAEVAAAIAKAL